MALTKVQLMSVPGGPGIVGAVQPGNNITISADGTISASASGGSVTSVGVSGGTTGLTFAGSPVTTSGTMTMGGVLAVANGGTGATNLTELQATVYPPQTGQSGNYLTTNGTATSWATAVSSLTANNGLTTNAGTGAVTVTLNISSLPELP